MSTFSTPPSKGFKPPEVVPLEQADPARKDEYAKLNDLLKEEAAAVPNSPLPEIAPEETKTTAAVDIPDSGFVVQPPITVELNNHRLTFQGGLLVALDRIEEKPEVDYAAPSDEEKQAFVRSILGMKTYERSITLFGSITAVFKDRDVAKTETMYEEARKHLEGKELSEEEWAVWIERFMLVSTFVKAGQTEFSGSLSERVTALMALPRPLYVALMAASRDFERHIEMLAAEAQNVNFWKAGGAGSR